MCWLKAIYAPWAKWKIKCIEQRKKKEQQQQRRQHTVTSIMLSCFAAFFSILINAEQRASQ